MVTARPAVSPDRRAHAAGRTGGGCLIRPAPSQVARVRAGQALLRRRPEANTDARYRVAQSPLREPPQGGDADDTAPPYRRHRDLPLATEAIQQRSPDADHGAGIVHAEEQGSGGGCHRGCLSRRRAGEARIAWATRVGRARRGGHRAGLLVQYSTCEAVLARAARPEPCLTRGGVGRVRLIHGRWAVLGWSLRRVQVRGVRRQRPPPCQPVVRPQAPQPRPPDWPRFGAVRHKHADRPHAAQAAAGQQEYRPAVVRVARLPRCPRFLVHHLRSPSTEPARGAALLPDTVRFSRRLSALPPGPWRTVSVGRSGRPRYRGARM